MSSYLLQEFGSKILLEDDSGALLLESSVPAPADSDASPPSHGPKRALPRPVPHDFKTGTARLLLRALQPSFVLLPALETAIVGSLRFSSPGAEFELVSEPAMKSLVYRAVPDDRFERDVEIAYLLTR